MSWHENQSTMLWHSSDSKYKPVIRIPLFETKRAVMGLDKEAIIQRLENGLRIQ